MSKLKKCRNIVIWSVHRCMCVYVHDCVCARVHLYVCIFVHLFVLLYEWISMTLFTICAHIYAYMFRCVSVCVYM